MTRPTCAGTLAMAQPAPRAGLAGATAALAGRIGYRLPGALLTVAVFGAIYGLLFHRDTSAALRPVVGDRAARAQ